MKNEKLLSKLKFYEDKSQENIKNSQERQKAHFIVDSNMSYKDKSIIIDERNNNE